MAYQPIQTISPEELVDFEDQRRLLEMMLDQSAKKRLMFVQTPPACAERQAFYIWRAFYCERKDIPWCRIDFRGQPYDNPHYTLALAICNQLGLSPDHMAQAVQPLSLYKPADAEATTHIEGNVTDSYVITQVLTTVSLTYEELRQRYMRERLTSAFAADLTNFAIKRSCVACLFDSFEDISAEEENWLLNALLSPIAMGEFKGVMVVVAGRRWQRSSHWRGKIPHI